MITSNNKSVTVEIPGTGTSVEILNYGATVISWKVNGEEKLFLSESAKLDGSKAVRGGIPLVFPRFGPSTGTHPATDKLPQHGFARQSVWEFLGERDPQTAQFALSPEQISPEARAQWPFDFTLLYSVKLESNSLKITMEVENPGSQPFDFNVLFHTYLRVPDITATTVVGLENLQFYNKVTDSNLSSGNEPVTIAGEVDRVYKHGHGKSEVFNGSKPLFTLNSVNLPDTVVWNPWQKGAEGLADFSPKDGYLHMLCVENGSVAEFQNLKPQQKWEATAEIVAHI